MNTKLISFTSLFFIFFLLYSCSDNNEPNNYKGKNFILLSAKNESIVFSENEENPLVINVDLTTSCSKDITLNFQLLDDKDGVLELEGNPVTIKAGSTKGSFKVKSKLKDLLIEERFIKVGISDFPLENMGMKSPLVLCVKPNPIIPQLSDSQKALLKGYKEKYNIDLSSWLGLIDCKTVVKSPEGGSTQNFVSAFTKEIKGKTLITLSEKSTPEQPVLKMIDNPMGLTEYLYWVMRKVTIEDGEFWTQRDNEQKLMKMINWDKNTTEEFSMTLDNIKLQNINSDSSELYFLGEKKNTYDDLITAVAFDYSFTPWSRQKKLLDKGDAEAKEVYEYGGSASPESHLFSSDITKDEFGDELNFFKPSGKIDFKKGEMTFHFVFDHTNAGGYSQITVSYTKK